MFSRRSPVEPFLYILALLVAFCLRLINLGALPLIDNEAGWALQALKVAEDLRPVIGSNPVYVHLTAALFFIFGSSNFLARFWTALAGGLLVLVPLFFRDRLGRSPALLLAFFLACDPGLLALSRQAGSTMLALTAVIFTGAFWQSGFRSAAGACAALALLSGPGAWFGIAGIALAWGIGSAFQVGIKTHVKGTPFDKTHWSILYVPIGIGVAVLLLVGTLFLFSPKGLEGILSALTGFISGWWKPSGVPVSRLLMTFPAYALMPLGFGLVGFSRGILKRDPFAIRLGIWVLAAFILALVYPARQVGDVIWVYLPLWTLAALELSHHFDVEKNRIWEVGGVIALLIAILIFVWLDFASVAGATLQSPFGQIRIFLMAGAFLLIVLILVLVSMGWSKDVARLGGVWGMAIMLTIYTLGMATGAGGLRRPLTEELWPPSPQIADADLLLQTAEHISEWSKGSVESLPVMISGVNSPALLWLLRNWEVSETMALSAGDAPAMVVTPADTKLNLAASYRGEEFRWRRTPDWSGAAITDWTSWLVHREFPTSDERIVLWVRSDLLIDSQDQSTSP